MFTESDESASGIDAKNVASTGKYVDVNTSSRNVNRVHDPRPLNCC